MLEEKGWAELKVSGPVEQVSQRCWDSWKLTGRHARQRCISREGLGAEEWV